MHALLMFGLLALGLAIPAVFLGLSRARSVHAGHQAALRYLGAGADGAVGDLGPATRWFAGIARRMTPAGFMESVRGRLSDLGTDLSAERFLAFKAIGGAAGATLGLWTMSSSFGTGLLVLAILAP